MSVAILDAGHDLLEEPARSVFRQLEKKSGHRQVEFVLNALAGAAQNSRTKK